MKYNVIVEPQNGHFRALIPALPHLVAEGASIEDAVQKMQDVAQQFIARMEVRTIELAMPATPTASEFTSQDWLNVAGQFLVDGQHVNEVHAKRPSQRDAIEREFEIAEELNSPDTEASRGSLSSLIRAAADCRINTGSAMYKEYAAELEAEKACQRAEAELAASAA